MGEHAYNTEISYIKDNALELKQDVKDLSKKVVDNDTALTKKIVEIEKSNIKSLGITSLTYKVAVGILIFAGGTFLVNAWAATKVMAIQGVIK